MFCDRHMKYWLDRPAHRWPCRPWMFDVDRWSKPQIHHLWNTPMYFFNSWPYILVLFEEMNKLPKRVSLHVGAVVFKDEGFVHVLVFCYQHCSYVYLFHIACALMRKLGLGVCMHMHVCVCECIFVLDCVCMFVSVCVCVCVCLCVSVYMHQHRHVFMFGMCACMCWVFIYVQACHIL